jgi:hypothetical protein
MIDTITSVNNIFLALFLYDIFKIIIKKVIEEDKKEKGSDE